MVRCRLASAAPDRDGTRDDCSSVPGGTDDADGAPNPGSDSRDARVEDAREPGEPLSDEALEALLAALD